MSRESWQAHSNIVIYSVGLRSADLYAKISLSASFEMFELYVLTIGSLWRSWIAPTKILAEMWLFMVCGHCSQACYMLGADTKPSIYALVLDLPQLYQKPTAPDLLRTLSILKVQPFLWTQNRHETQDDRIQVDEDGIPKYLTSIISSPLSWIKDEQAREEIWETASTRIAERSGRTGRVLAKKDDLLATADCHNQPSQHSRAHS